MDSSPGRMRLRLLVVVLGVAILAVGANGLIQIWQGIGQPFPGFIVSRDLVVTQLNQPYWNGVGAGLRPGDVIVGIDGRDLRSPHDLIRAVRSEPEGTTFRYTIVRSAGRLERSIASSVFSAVDFASTFGILAMTAMAFLIVGSLVAWLRQDSLGAGVYGFFFAVAFAMGVSTDLAWTREFPLSTLWYPLLVAGLLHFALVFPEPRAALRRDPRLAFGPYVAMLPLAIANLSLGGRSAAFVSGVERVNRWLTLLAALVLLAGVVRAARQRLSSRTASRRVRIVLRGLILAVACYATGFLGAEFGVLPSAPTSIFVIPAWIWLVAVGWAVLRDDVFDLGMRVREALIRPVVFALMVSFYLTLLAATHFVVGGIARSPQWLWLGFLLVAVILFDPVRRTVGSLVSRGVREQVLFRTKVLRDLTVQLASSLDEREIVDSVTRMSERIGATETRLFLAGPDEWCEANGSARLDENAPLVLAVRESGAGLSVTDPESEVARQTMTSLGLTLAFPLRSRGNCIGFLGVGTEPSDGSVGNDDFRRFSTLAGQIAVALENARVFRRIRELEEELRVENVVLKEELVSAPSLEGLVGRSHRMQELYRVIEQVAPTDTTVLIRGETGTGKELVARALHARSLRRSSPMIRVNCAAIHPTLLESEFFGHERGAFTGAVSRKPGRFELAAGGTIFLDEIADLPIELQPKLLRVLQDREFERVGGSTRLVAEVRVIAATNRDLEALVRRGRFREDLFFRLNVLSIEVPPLRDRREDIPALVAALLQRYAGRNGKRIRTIEERSLRAMMAYHWPGNVRELENVIERAVILSPDDRLVVREIGIGDVEGPAETSLRPLSEILRDVKVRTIRRALSETAGNQVRAAELLELKPSSLSRMMKSLGLRE